MFGNKINQSKLHQGQIAPLRGIMPAHGQRVKRPSPAEEGSSLEIMTAEVRGSENGTVGFSLASPVFSHLSAFH